MKKSFFVIFCVVGCFLIEGVLSVIFGRWFSPNLLIILVVFFNLFRGIRYSLAAAFLAGLLKDSFSPNLFGLNIFSFLLCAYLTTFIKMYIYHSGSVVLRMFLVFVISLINIIIHYILTLMVASIPFGEMFVHLLLPEVTATVIITNYAFKKFKECALKLFV